MQNTNSLDTVAEKIEGNSMSFGALNAGQGRNPTKVRSRTLPGDSTLLEGRALTDCRGIIFKRIHCAFEVLNVEKLREFVAACANFSENRNRDAVPPQLAPFECGTTA